MCGDDDARLDQLSRVARTGISMVATNDVLMHQASRRPLLDILNCIRKMLLLIMLAIRFCEMVNSG